jgi:hypothetical protein
LKNDIWAEVERLIPAAMANSDRYIITTLDWETGKIKTYDIDQAGIGREVLYGKNKRGGKRPGAGRKPGPLGKGEFVRFYLPAKLAKLVHEYVARLRREFL